MDRRAFLATTGAGVAAAVSGCLTRGLSDADFDIGMSQNSFLPDEYEVPVGETVVWGNNGSRGHTVTAYERLLPEGADYFASGGYEDLETARNDWHSQGGGNIPPGETYEHTFEVPGRYGYLCIPHEPSGMVGTVVVTD
jgi:plastocyanin